MPFFSSILVSWLAVVFAFLFHSRAVVFVSYAITNPLIILALYAVIRYSSIGSICSREWYRKMNRLIMVILLLNAPGSIFLHGLGIQYDRFLHFTIGFVFIFAITTLSAPFFVRLHPNKGIDKRRVIMTAVVVVFVGLFAWELTQWSVDQVFGTQLFHDAVQTIVRDTTEDILFGFAGLLLAVLYIHRSKTFWPRLTRSLKEDRFGVKRNPAKPE
ncbi:MAG: hypothetical protein NUV81_03905 [bacterium]|nr:hypothetical protein [bacterium]